MQSSTQQETTSTTTTTSSISSTQNPKRSSKLRSAVVRGNVDQRKSIASTSTSTATSTVINRYHHPYHRRFGTPSTSGSGKNNNTILSSIGFVLMIGFMFHTFLYTNTKTRVNNRNRQRLSTVVVSTTTSSSSDTASTTTDTKSASNQGVGYDPDKVIQTQKKYSNSQNTDKYDEKDDEKDDAKDADNDDVVATIQGEGSDGDIISETIPMTMSEGDRLYAMTVQDHWMDVAEVGSGSYIRKNVDDDGDLYVDDDTYYKSSLSFLSLSSTNDNEDDGIIEYNDDNDDDDDNGNGKGNDDSNENDDDDGKDDDDDKENDDGNNEDDNNGDKQKENREDGDNNREGGGRLRRQDKSVAVENESVGESKVSTSSRSKTKKDDDGSRREKDHKNEKQKPQRDQQKQEKQHSTSSTSRKTSTTISGKITKSSSTSSSSSKAISLIHQSTPKYYMIQPIHKLLKEAEGGGEDEDTTTKTTKTKKSGFNDKSIIGDVSGMLDFAILGHAKCATSFLMSWFNKHDEIQIWDYEVCYLYDHKPEKLVQKIYNEFIVPTTTNTTTTNTNTNTKLVSSSSSSVPIKKTKKIGFKCPGHFSRPSLRYFHDYFTNTVLIVGLRHPVLWFESYYNFRFRHSRPNMTLPQPHELLMKNNNNNNNNNNKEDEEECPPNAMGVCTMYAKFHQNLAKFGKSNWKTNKEERILLNLEERIQSMRTIHNPIFLYDTAQFYDTDIKRKQQLKFDIQSFLGLTKDLGTLEDAPVSTRGKVKAMKICDDQYLNVRTELIEIGKQASLWIRKYFITLPDVYVSTPKYFEEILKTYQYDPCTTNITELLLSF